MNAIKFILSEHQKIKKMLAGILKGSPKDETKRKRFHRLTNFLVHHEKMEQKIWYPFLKKNTKLATVINHLVSEEKSAAKAIGKIRKIKPEDKWEDKFKDLRKDVLHHASEEEKKLFPKVKKVLDDAELKFIGKKAQAFKKALDKTTKK